MVSWLFCEILLGQLNIFSSNSYGLRDGSNGKVLAPQAQGAHFSQNSNKIARCSGVSAFLVLGRQRQEDPRGALACQSSLIGEVQTIKRPSERKWMVLVRMTHEVVPCLLHTHTHTYIHTCIHSMNLLIHKHMPTCTRRHTQNFIIFLK